MDIQTKLRRVAELHGLQSSYTDISGNTQTARPESLVQSLRALGVPIGDARDADLDEALRDVRSRQATEVVAPVVVAWNGVGSVQVRVPLACTGRWTVEIEGQAEGDAHRTHSSTRLESAPIVDQLDVEGVRYVTRTLPLPGPLPWGYFTLRLQGPDVHPPASLLVSAPRRVFTPDDERSGWGLFMPLYALRSARDHGVGDFTDLGELGRWTGQHGGTMVGTLPLLATFLDEPCEPSPYAPVSRLAWNELHLDVEALPEYRTTAAAQAAFTDADAAKVRTSLQEARKVDYRAAMALKRRALQPMADACFSSDGPRAAALRDFLAGRPELEAYAKFRAVGTTRAASWQDWPEPLRSGTLKDGSYDAKHFRYHAYVQWAAHQQLEALAQAETRGAQLYLDLPVGVHGDGFDTWRHRESFVLGLGTGAPADALFAGGQNWAFPPPHPERIRTDHYGYLIAVLRNHMRYASMLRIDHVMGLHRLFVLPSHAPASDGVYLRYRADELYAVLSLESHRNRTLLVGEDLGTVPDEVRHAMQTHGFSGMHVVQYQARPDAAAALPPVRPTAVASLNTHDMPPFAAYWTGADLQTQRELGLLDTAAHDRMLAARTHQRECLASFLGDPVDAAPPAEPATALGALLGHLGRSEARLVVVNLEDLWGETRAQNVPGTYREHPNWQNRAQLPVEAWTQAPAVLAAVDELNTARAVARHRGEVRDTVTLLSEDDLYLWNEGTHSRMDERLGAHPMTAEGVRGTYFAVWAPSADYVSVIGDFNGWDRGRSPLRARERSGIWEGFVVGVHHGDLYKLHVASEAGASDRADPFAFATEVPPRTASIVTHREYTWRDGGWMADRSNRSGLSEPMSIYEVHLGSWRRVPEQGDRMLTYRELASSLVEHVVDMGFTHVELLPVMEHPFYGSWGYQTTSYFAPTARHGTPADLKALIDALHGAGIGVILDWVPSHFPIDPHALARFDGTHLYEHADPRQGFHPDWTSAIFNYSRHEVRAFLQSSARYWCEAFHADGLRVDGVASMLYLDYSRAEGDWVPNAFGGRENLGAIEALRQINETVYRECPGAHTIAEESTSWPMVSRPTHAGGLGFGFKWDMGWMHDTLQYFSRDPIHRRYHHHELTFRMLYAFGENFVLPLSHDEVVHGKGSLLGRMPGDQWQRFANLRALYGYMYGQPGKKLVFMGCEFGQEREWNHEQSLDWHLLGDPMHDGVRMWVRDLNRLYRSLPALHQRDCDPSGFSWVDIADVQASVYTFLRFGNEGAPVLVVCNLTPTPRDRYAVGVPEPGWWHELANSDAREYGGSGMGNAGGQHAGEPGTHGRPYRLELTLPPLSVVFFSPQRGQPA